jgi:hypothetical protein
MTNVVSLDEKIVVYVTMISKCLYKSLRRREVPTWIAQGERVGFRCDTVCCTKNWRVRLFSSITASPYQAVSCSMLFTKLIGLSHRFFV